MVDREIITTHLSRAMAIGIASICGLILAAVLFI